MIPEAIERYAAGAGVPGKAIEGLSREELNSFPVPGTWSIQELVMHLMDSDLIGSDRMKRVAAMDRPLLIGYDETAFNRVLKPERIDARAACQLFELNRRMTADILRGLPEEAFARWGVHNETGKRTLMDLVTGYADHLDHHMKFLHAKRTALGKPLK